MFLNTQTMNVAVRANDPLPLEIIVAALEGRDEYAAAVLNKEDQSREKALNIVKIS